MAGDWEEVAWWKDGDGRGGTVAGGRERERKFSSYTGTKMSHNYKNTCVDILAQW